MIKDQKHDFTTQNERLKNIVDNILDLIIEMDLNGKFTYVSPQSFQILGYTPEELIGRKAIDFIHPDDFKSFVNMMRHPIQYNKSHSFDLRLKHKNGNFIYISAKGVIFNQNHESKHIIVLRDVSHEVLAERKVKESEQHYRKVIESIGDPIQVIDSNLQIVMANTTFKEWINLYGINSEVIGKTPFEIFPFLPNDVADEYEYVFESGQNLTTEECIDLDGNTIYIETRKIPILTNGKVTQIITVLKDITEKKKSDQYYEESEEKFRNIANQSFMSIAIIQNGLIKYFNKRVSEINGFSSSEIKNWKPYEFLKMIHHDDKEFVFNQAKKKESGDKDVIEQYKYRLVRKTGEIRWIELFSKPINYKGEPAILAMSIDITDKVFAEQKLQESEEKYRNLFEDSPYMIFLIDLKGKILDLNQTALESITYRKKDLIGKNFSTIDIMRNKNLSSLTEKYKKVLKNEFLDPFEIYINSPKIKLDWMKIQAKIVYIGDKKHIQVIVEDISEKKKAEKMLKESEKKYQNIIENTKDAIVIIDLNGKLQYISPQLSVILKLKGKEINETSKFFKNIHEDDVQEIISFFQKAILEKSSPDKILEFRILDNEKNYIYLSSVSKNYYDDEGNIAGFITTIQDITDKKLAEQKLKDSEAGYRLITENSNDLIRMLNKDFKIEFFNEETHRKVLGYSKEEILNKTDMYFNHPDDFKEINRYMLRVFKKGEDFHESRLRHKNGEYIWFEVKIKCFRDEQEQQKYLLVYRDINERKKTEQKLKKSEETYRNLYEKSPVAIVLTTDKGIILEHNQASEKIFGYRADEVYGKNFQEFDVFNLEQIKIIKETYKDLLKGFKVNPRELMIKKKDGSVVWINWQISNIIQKELNLVETIAQDITEQKKAQLLIEKENEKLLELNKMKTELVSRASHELKTPLNSIYGGTQILLNLYKAELSVEALGFLEMIHKGGERLKKLIESLLDTSRIESNKLILNIQNHNLSEIIKECVDEMMYFAGEREVDITLNLLNNLECEIDRLRIEQVITNLLSNAIKNTPSMGLVNVKLSKKGNDIYLSVEDTGIGLTIGEMEKLFNKFGKIERYGQHLNVDIEGSGLGLFITKEIIDLHKGSIWVESEGKNKGSTFKVKLNKYYPSD